MPPQEPPDIREKFDRNASRRDRHASNRFLDNIPIRNSLGSEHPRHTTEGRPLVPVAHLSRRTESPMTSQSSQWEQSDDDESYSPTASEVDALEESICDYETQSTLAESTDVSQSVSHTTYVGSASYLHDGETESGITYPSLSGYIDEPEPQKPSSLIDRLRLIWRELLLLDGLT